MIFPLPKPFSRWTPLLPWVLSAPLLQVSVLGQDLPVRIPDFPVERPASVDRPEQPEQTFDAQAIAAQPIDRLLFDQPGDGALWVRGTSYKASFDGYGATVVPFFGSDAPQNYPVAFRIAEATLAGTPLEVATDSTAVRDGDVVRIDRGTFSEEYHLSLDRLEQRFVFDALPRTGDLVVRIDVATELVRHDRGASLRFENARGHVDYGEAFAIDAGDRRVALQRSMSDGALELRVPAAFVEQAVLPLVIDPFVTFFTVGGGPRDEFLPDVSYDLSTDRWCITWADVWSATDYDIYARVVSGSGVLSTIVNIDFTTDNWTLPAIANNRATNRFLVCAAVIPGAGPSHIRGRIITSGLAPIVNGVLQISPLDGVSRSYPDVGGDPYPGQSYFCVVWHRAVSPTNFNIEYQLVTPDGTLQGNVAALESGPDWHELPSISNSLGLDVGDNTARWTVTWQRRFNASDYDIYAAQIFWDGTIITPIFPIQTSSLNEQRPVVSTLLDPTTPGAPRPYMIVYERDYGDHDLIATIVQGSTILVSEVNLVGAFDSAFWYRDQRSPSVDSDGEQFLVGFDERDLPGGPNPDVFICSYYWSGGQLVPCELHQYFAGSVVVEGEIAVHSMASSGGPDKRYFGTWVYQSLNQGYDVQGGLWDGCSGGLVDSLCAGIGCPCGNNGSNGRGCGNSVNPAGALLTTSGNASIAADTLTLLASGMPTTATCLFFQSETATPAAPFGDGLRCATGPTIRFPLKQSSAGAASYPEPGDASVHTIGQVFAVGLTRYYQGWYRDTATFCTSQPFNLTNALRVIWAP